MPSLNQIYQLPGKLGAGRREEGFL